MPSALGVGSCALVDRMAPKVAALADAWRRGGAIKGDMAVVRRWQDALGRGEDRLE